jgi:hypothetical protein
MWAIVVLLNKMDCHVILRDMNLVSITVRGYQGRESWAVSFRMKRTWNVIAAYYCFRGSCCSKMCVFQKTTICINCMRREHETHRHCEDSFMSLNSSISIWTKLSPRGSRKCSSTSGMRKFFLHCQQHPYCLWDPLSLLPNEYRWSLRWGWMSWNRKLTTYLLVLRLSTHGDIPPLSHVSSWHGV